MNKPELIEQLADKEHAGWAHWMKYLFSKCLEVGDKDEDGYESVVIPRELVKRWQRQVATPYAELSEKEKQSDRNQVADILPIIDEYVESLQKLIREFAEYTKLVTPRSSRAKQLRKQAELLLREEIANAADSDPISLG